MHPRAALPLIALLLVTACATGPRFETTGVATDLTPRGAALRFDEVRAERVLWGGIIVDSTHPRQGTRLEVLAFPLENQSPQTQQAPLGRFLVIEPGYLETADYAPGRRVTVVGRLGELRQGRIGEAEYTYPVVRADDIHLWPRETAAAEPRVHFGFGVIFNR